METYSKEVTDYVKFLAFGETMNSIACSVLELYRQRTYRRTDSDNEDNRVFYF